MPKGIKSIRTLTQSRLKAVLRYYSQTGVFVWKIKSANCIHIGDVVKVKRNQYTRIQIDGQRYYAQCLAWLYVHGVWPVEVDHKDTVKHHNWIDNLREVTRTENNQNHTKANKNNKLRLMGVSLNKASGKPVAQIAVNGKKIHLGTFDTPEEAHEIYLAAKRKYHSTCTI
jgi:hypothetical protein